MIIAVLLSASKKTQVLRVSSSGGEASPPQKRGENKRRERKKGREGEREREREREREKEREGRVL